MTFDEFSKSRGIPRSTLHYMLSTDALKSVARKIATRKGVRVWSIDVEAADAILESRNRILAKAPK